MNEKEFVEKLFKLVDEYYGVQSSCVLVAGPSIGGVQNLWTNYRPEHADWWLLVSKQLIDARLAGSMRTVVDAEGRYVPEVKQ